MFRRTLILLCLSLPVQAQQFESGVEQNQLIELYTSEGCSSCPPADRFLGTLQHDDLLWTRRIPVALHVDYWDGLGWPDPYANNSHTRRQTKYKDLGLTDSVYTPQFVVSGNEWRAYFSRKSLPKQSKRKVGVLSLTIANRSYSAKFHPHKTNKQVYVLNIAQLAMNVEQAVANGENRGKILSHNFLATNHQQNLNQGLSWTGTLQTANSDAYAAWISLPYSQKPLQSVGGYSEHYLSSRVK